MLGYLLVVRPEIRREVFTAMIYGIFALEALIALVERPKIKTRYFIGALTMLGIAYGVWIFDERRVLCDPSSIVQGHAMWHLLTAVAALLLFQYYRSEEGKVN